MEKPTQTQDSPTAKPAAPVRKKGRWFSKVLIFSLFCLAVLIAVLPQILSTASIRQQLAISMLQDFDGKVEIGGADLAWWRPAELSDMTMTDKAGEPLAKIESAKVSAPLWRMLWPGSAPLELKINRPEIVYEIDAYGRTNWERVFTSLKDDKSQGFKWPEFRHTAQPINIVVTEGRLLVKDHVSNRTIETEQIEAEVKKSAKFLEGVLTGQTQLITETEEEIPAGNVQAEFQLAMAGDKVVAGDVTGEIRQTPLELIQPWLKQMIPHLYLATGTTDGTIKSKWTGDFRSGIKLAVDGTLTASDVTVRSSQWIPGNELTGADLTGKFAIDNTLPTAPGSFDIQWELTESLMAAIPREELEADPAAVEEHRAHLEAVPLPEPLLLGTLKLKTLGTIDVLRQALLMKEVSLSSNVLRLEMNGEIRQFATGSPDFDLAGAAEGDILPFVLLAYPEWREIVSGKRLTPEEFALKGRLALASSSAASTEEAPTPASPVEQAHTVAAETGEQQAVSADAPPAEPFSAVARWGWEEFEVYGVPSRKGGLWTRFEDQQLRIVPIDLQIGEHGKFVAKAVIDFRNDQRLLNIEEGYVLQDVAFTEKMCRSWLKYVAPVFAEATDLEGQFSLYLKPSVIDLNTGLADELDGVLQIQSTRLGPGPMIQRATAPLQSVAQLANRRDAGLLKEGAKWIELPKQDVVFKKYEGRVYHNQLTFQAGKVSIISQGSVGDDQTLDLAINIPLDFIAQGRPLGQILQQQQPLKMFIRGTFAKPEIDASQLGNIGKQIGVNAVDGLLQDLIQRRQGR